MIEDKPHIKVPPAVELVDYPKAGFTVEQQHQPTKPMFCTVCRPHGLTSFPVGCIVCGGQGVILVKPPTHTVLHVPK